MDRVTDRTSLRFLGVCAAALEDLQFHEAERHEAEGEPGHDPGEEHEEAGGARVRPPLERPERGVLPPHDQRHRAHPRRRGRARHRPRRRRHDPHRRSQARRPRPPRSRRHLVHPASTSQVEREPGPRWPMRAWAPYKEEMAESGGGRGQDGASWRTWDAAATRLGGVAADRTAAEGTRGRNSGPPGRNTSTRRCRLFGPFQALDR